MNEPLTIGTKVKPWGTICGVTNHGGERYYFFEEKGVALIPASDVERMAKMQDRVCLLDNDSSIEFEDHGDEPIKGIEP